MRVTRVCLGQREVGDMIRLVRQSLVPGYCQALLVDQSATSQSQYDSFLRMLRSMHP